MYIYRVNAMAIFRDVSLILGLCHIYQIILYVSAAMSDLKFVHASLTRISNQFLFFMSDPFFYCQNLHVTLRAIPSVVRRCITNILIRQAMGAVAGVRNSAKFGLLRCRPLLAHIKNQAIDNSRAAVTSIF